MNVLKQRDVSIDIAKGIGIILVVFGHTFQIYSVTSWIYAFHMPLFFLLAGYTFNTQENLQNPKRFLKKTFLKLMVPYFAVGFFSYFLYVFLAPTLSLPEVTVNDAALGILNGNGINLPFDVVLWFLPALFFAGAIFLILRFMLKEITLFIGVMAVSVLGIVIGLYYHLPQGFDIAMTVQLFMYCGHILKRTDVLKKIRQNLNTGFLMGIALSMMLVTFVFNSMNGRIDLMTRIYGQPFMFFIAALSGSISVLFISVFFSTQGHRYNFVGRILETSGRASMYTYISHIPLAYCFASVCVTLWGFWIYYTFDTYWYLIFIIGLSVPTLIYVLITLVRNHRKT